MPIFTFGPNAHDMKKDLTIFYADDDVDDLEFFSEVAGSIDDGITVSKHDSGQRLIDALHNPPPSPHIIFLDLNMPGRNGFEILQELKTTAHLKEIPVVVFSTSSDEQNINRSRQLGANFYLPKLSSYEDFKKSIEHTLTIDWNNFDTNGSSFLYSA